MANLSRKTGKLFLFVSATALLLASCTESVAPLYEGSQVHIVETSTLSDLEEAFYKHSYDLSQLTNGVPPIIFSSLPEELGKIRSSSRKKKLFFQALLPMVLLANEEIAAERKSLLYLAKRIKSGAELTEEQVHILSTLQQRYKVSGDFRNQEVREKLMRRIDQIPAELALAQAANESAWGTSRFSQLGNNLFGEWTFVPGTGIVPEGRPDGATYEVKRFETLYDSIRSYLRNLNTHAAYADFRELREGSRIRGDQLNGEFLAQGLHQYSTRREDYVSDLQDLIRQNNMKRFAHASLRQG